MCFTMSGTPGGPKTLLFYSVWGARGADNHVFYRVRGARRAENQIFYHVRGARWAENYVFYHVRGARGQHTHTHTHSHTDLHGGRFSPFLMAETHIAGRILQQG